ncbi:MAG: NAD(P)-dependent glycerol-3-phosphate dehydrogenase [Coriobacteriia bacterium]|nr:NAD(P)-dependent glycerol-3-phosphate dehydrogenase [Coriobacteriia bacterium]MCL2745872.1 NAD(P)-dependent glycerol-3-phosphate dehydrogenase [Coriobacteriia bacterium]MCL2870332.1 NAD(P)-dependent glycerol-3-phosphate dehydrogenase [Coriobacteriia bacterium]
MTKICVIGAGSWGTAVAWLLDGKGHSVRVWAFEPEIADAINNTGRNPVYLPHVKFSDRISATADVGSALKGADAVVMVTPSIGVRATAEKMAEALPEDVPVIILSKGLEAGTHLLMTEILEEVLGNPERIAALSGPNHAEEVSKAVPSATVVAAHNEEVAGYFQELFSTPFFRVYTNNDLIGVELCGAGKNVIAIACGMCDGLGLGDNAKASLMTRGLAELVRLGEAVGAKTDTFRGLAGMGDLIVTCTSKHSRNRSLGEGIARGDTLEGYQERTKMVVEGAVACNSIYELARDRDIEVPITQLIYEIIYEGLDLERGMAMLMDRPLRKE